MGFLYKDGLSALKCSVPGCDHKAEFVVSRCHPNAGVLVELNEMGVLTVRCAACRKYVVQIPIHDPVYASSPESDLWEIQQACHLDRSLEVSISINTGELRLFCMECKATVFFAFISTQAEWEDKISSGENSALEEKAPQDEIPEVVEITGDGVYIHDLQGEEIVCWVESEWTEDPSIVPTILNAVKIALTKGPEEVRRIIHRGDRDDDDSDVEFRK
jgi:hypothetical protein